VLQAEELSMQEDLEEDERIRQEFGLGRDGEPVAIVDPEDVKAVWEVEQESVMRHPQGNVAIGIESLRRACKPGANVSAVIYRTWLIRLRQMIQPDTMDPLLQNKPEAVFRAAAEIPMEWIGVSKVRHGLPYDFDDFLRRVREA
jgi:hypothetical protein